MKNVVISVEGMTCNHCVHTVEGAIKKLNGVINAKVNLQDKNVMVDYDENEIRLDQMKEAIEDQGYDVQ